MRRGQNVLMRGNEGRRIGRVKMGRRGDNSTDVTAILMREMGRKRKTRTSVAVFFLVLKSGTAM